MYLALEASSVDKLNPVEGVLFIERGRIIMLSKWRLKRILLLKPVIYEKEICIDVAECFVSRLSIDSSLTVLFPWVSIGGVRLMGIRLINYLIPFDIKSCIVL